MNRHGYIYNAGHQITRQTRTDSGYVNYTSDDGAELQTASTFTSGNVAIPAENYGFAYDPGMNMLRRTNNASTTVYPVNPLNQVTGGLATYSYDRRGNRTSTSNYENYTYDEENQLVQYTIQPGGSDYPNFRRTDFAYDARLRLRIRKEYIWVGTSGGAWMLSTETRYLYDGMRVIQERDSSNSIQVSYTRGPDLSGSFEGAGGIGGLLARTAHSGVNKLTFAHAFYHADRRGNVTYLLNSANTMGATYKYDPFGRTLSISGTLAPANVYRFSSKEWCATSGLYYYGYRFYDSLTQRWMNRDRIRFIELVDGPNLLTFVRNQPIEKFDSFGTTVYECCRKVDGTGKLVAIGNALGARHCWLRTDSKEAGMGPDNDSPLPSYPCGIKTRINDHSKEKADGCNQVYYMDEDCVNSALDIGAATGKWGPLNNCNTLIGAIREKCYRGPRVYIIPTGY